uniref:Secreted protein n=1 Tax=Caenorhabditis tropicalis TaxID=1561998 RepID=A0A1I7TU21_9PELO
MSHSYACASICSVPSARSVPMPPIEWLNQLQVSSETSRPSSSLSSESFPTSSSSSSSIHNSSSHGIRLCPFQLIAAAASA